MFACDKKGEQIVENHNTDIPKPRETKEVEDDSDDEETIIEEQSFQVTLSEWGDVKFASFLPDENSEGDVSFKLLKEGKEIYSFPEYYQEDRQSHQQFREVRGVAFKDCNNDGKTDIIIINDYTPLSGSNTEETYNQVRIYTQPESEKEFVLDLDMAEYLMTYYYNDSISSIMEGLQYYPEYKQALENPPVKEDEFWSVAYDKYMGSWSEEELDQRSEERLGYHNETPYSSEVMHYMEGIGVTDVTSIMEPIFFTDMKFYTSEEFEAVPESIIHIAKNEIYARHGYIFKKEELNNYFMGCLWYMPTCESGDFNDSVFNIFEKMNLKLLAELDKR